MTPPEVWGANTEWRKNAFSCGCPLWGQHQPAHLYPLVLFARQTKQLLTEKLGFLQEVLQNKQNKAMTVLADSLVCSSVRVILKKKKVSLKFFSMQIKPGNSSHYSLCKVTWTSWVIDLWPSWDNSSSANENLFTYVCISLNYSIFVMIPTGWTHLGVLWIFYSANFMFLSRYHLSTVGIKTWKIQPDFT